MCTYCVVFTRETTVYVFSFTDREEGVNREEVSGKGERPRVKYIEW